MSKMKKMFKFRRSTTDLSEWNKSDEKLWAAVQGGDVEKMENLLVKKGIMATKFNQQGLTTFNRAAGNGKTQAIKIFLEHNVDVNAVDQNGQTALHCACRHGQLEVVQQLLEANSNISADDHQDLTPLHHACMSGSLQTVQLLLKNKAGVNPKDKLGRTPLFIASRLGNQPICKELLDRGAKINERDKDKKTPLMFAAGYGHEDVCDHLVKGGSNVLMTDNAGNTASWYAQEAGFPEIKKILDNAPSRASWDLEQVPDREELPRGDAVEPMNFVSTFVPPSDEDSPEKDSGGSPDRPKDAPPPPPGFGSPHRQHASHMEQLEYGVVPMEDVQDEDPEQKSAGAGLIEAYVSDTVDQITAEIVSDDVRQLEQTNSHLQMSPEAVSAVESMTLQASATTEPSGVAHQNQPEKKAVDLDVYQELEEEHECLNSELQQVAIKNKHLQEKVELLERRLSNTSSGTLEERTSLIAPMETAIDSTIIETLEEELAVAQAELSSEKERTIGLEDEVKQLRKQIDIDSKPEAERNADDSWNDSDDDLFESDKLKKSSSGGTDAALIALLRSQILGLEQENEELKGKIQMQTFSSDPQITLQTSLSESATEDELLEMKRFQETQNAHDMECEQLRSHIKGLIEENAIISNQLSSAIAQKTELAMAKDDMEVKVSELSNNKTQVESELQRLQSLIDNPITTTSVTGPDQVELEIIQTENLSLKAENERLNAEFVEIDKQVEALQQLAEYNTELQQENEKLKQENDQFMLETKRNDDSDQKAIAQLATLLQQENNDLKSDNRTLKSKVAEIERNVKESLAQKELARTHFSVVEDDNAKLKSEIESFKQALDKQRFDSHTSTEPADVLELKSQTSHLKNTISQQQETIVELMQQSARDAQLQQDYEALQKESEVLKSSMEQFKNLMQNQSNTEDGAQAEHVSALEQEIMQLQGYNMHLNEKLSTQTSAFSPEENNNVEQQLCDVQALNDILEKDKSRLEARVSQLESEVMARKHVEKVALMTEISILQQQVEHLNMANSRLEIAADQNIDELSLLKKQKSLLQDENAQLQHRIQQAEASLSHAERLSREEEAGLKEENQRLLTQIGILEESLSTTGRNTPDYFELKAKVKQLETKLESERNDTVMTILDGRTAEQKSTEISLKETVLSLTRENERLKETLEQVHRQHHNNGNVEEIVQINNAMLLSSAPQLMTASRTGLNGDDHSNDKTKLDFGKSLQKRSIELRMTELEEENDRLRNQIDKLIEKSMNPATQEQVTLAQQQIATLQEKLEEVERRHNEVVSTYRAHLLRAVQGRMDTEVQQALMHIIKIRKSPEEFC